ncbi:hypothetical protein H5P28_19250 [Ruficoccus amylovorans]|uniref:CMP/dCMP-type deaminase domain-containing protein n=1 Tax=Ruficoccus amylovorans TaxID=1804625 RepID=A0A842HMU9_9BACT|nr:anti-phage dCTP deaminase [Ruficoccus amylovorans]MBC2596411.1 hypothetical protein [Ruficoccus amylovorans]
MAVPAQKEKPIESRSYNESTIELLEAERSQELVIALCGPIGTQIHQIAELMNERLNEHYCYDSEVVKLSSFIAEKHPFKGREAEHFSKIEHFINSGNSMRNAYGAGVLAELAVHYISIKRHSKMSERQVHPGPVRFCHIIDSIKNVHELTLLRSVYSDVLVTVGAYDDKDRRVASLKRKGVSEEDVYRLIDRDSGEEYDNGQSVRKVFPQCDYFINCSDDVEDIQAKVDRFLGLITGSSLVTPTNDERNMCHAYYAGLNSACLSRQVGASLADSNGDLIGIGWNDVPQFGGGLYSENSEQDKRCFKIKDCVCHNDFEKNVIIDSIVEDLRSSMKTEDLDRLRDRLRRGRIGQLLEFSRSVHAEMYAILDSSAKGGGLRIKGGSIYVTTYPCHNCARHIVAAGIHNVYYLEPYSKSMAIRLHEDAITENVNNSNMVRVIPYEGIGPEMFARFFKMPEGGRKKNGKMIPTREKSAILRSSFSMRSYPQLESIVVESLKRKQLVGNGSKN